MPTYSRLLTVSLVVEQDAASASDYREEFRSDDEIISALLTAITDLHDQQEKVSVSWQSTGIQSLDDCQAQGLCGRCSQCNRWVYDAENVTDLTPTGLGKAAFVNGDLRCDDCLPADHPIAF